MNLDIVDPILQQPPVREEFTRTLEAAAKVGRISGNLNAAPGPSPQAVEAIVARTPRKWSLIFIDGNHDAPGPLNDAVVSAKYAADDAMILLHDLASPEVAQALDYLDAQGWQTMVYQTMQVMGVAWRGNVQPVHHTPDPAVNWTMPEHLARYDVSGMAVHS